ncbi:MAG TPA: hypothetical protein VLH13_00080 [Methanomassiliicoccales archaeon]|nr:hypothetical protein [Methanomassiliicoccales archaeon]
MTFTGIKKTGLMAIVVLALLQCVARFAIPIMSVTGNGPGFETEQDFWVEPFVLLVFVIIGTVGLYTTYGLWKQEMWGYSGTFYLSLATIAFDVWAWMAIQPSAAMGIVPPAVIIVFLLVVRNEFAPGVKLLENARGVRN